MPISLQRVSVTGVEPVTLAEMKTHLRVDFTDDDDLITGLITAARQRAENVTGRCIVTSTWVYYMDSFPYSWYEQNAPARNSITKVLTWWANSQLIRLPQNPVQSVTSVSYIPDNSGNYTTLNPSTYVVDTTSEPCVLYPLNNYYWPQVWATHNCVKITFISGYGDNCPEDIKVAIRLMVAGWYEQREDSPTIPKAAEYLLATYRSQPCGYVR